MASGEISERECGEENYEYQNEPFQINQRGVLVVGMMHLVTVIKILQLVNTAFRERESESVAIVGEREILTNTFVERAPFFIT